WRPSSLFLAARAPHGRSRIDAVGPEAGRLTTLGSRRNRALDCRRLQAGSDERREAPRVSHNPIEIVLSRLRGVRKTAEGWDALCPAHDDQRPSLGIAVTEDGKVLLNCRSQGCSAGLICKAIGLTLRDLFPSQNGKCRMDIIAEYNYVD